MTTEVRHLTVNNDDEGQRLDRWLKKNVPELPYVLAQKLMRKGQIRVNGGRVKPDTKLSGGQDVRIPPIKARARPEKPELTEKEVDFIKSLVIYQDDHVIALNKPPGLATQGGTKVNEHIDGLLDGLMSKDGVRPRLVHRLDKDTSGVILLARSAQVARTLGESFKGRDIKKIYWAVVSPTPEQYEGTIKAPLIKSGGTNRERMVVDEEEGKYAATDYIMLENAHHSAAFMAFWPRTGRTHQIRVHAELIGCPIVGDKKYSRLPEQEESHEARRKAEADLAAMNMADTLHLHARRLILPHPQGEGTLDITAQLPPVLAASWKTLGFSTKLKNDPFEV